MRLVPLLFVLALTGCARAATESRSAPEPAITAKTPCSKWLHDSMATRASFLTGYWTNLSSTHVAKVIEIKDVACKAAEEDAEPGRQPPVGPFQPLVNEVISGTYG